MNVIVLAKSPVAGRSKTRLSPPLTLGEAAAFAEASLSDTLEAVARCSADRKVLVLDGPRGGWLRDWIDGIDVIPQRGAALGERLAAAFQDVGAPAVLIGMDTPQVRPGLLDACCTALLEREVDAVIGLAVDGGWWALGVRRVVRGLFDGVPMSSAWTGAFQLARLASLGLRTSALPVLRDVDRLDDAVAVARGVPTTRSSEWIRRWFAACREPDGDRDRSLAGVGSP